MNLFLVKIYVCRKSKVEYEKFEQKDCVMLKVLAKGIDVLALRYIIWKLKHKVVFDEKDMGKISYVQGIQRV